MFAVRSGFAALVLVVLQPGCSSCPPCEAKAAGAEACPQSSASALPAQSSATTTSVPPAGAATPAPTAPTASAPPAATEPPPDPAGALPEVKVENVGLHIGGGPNDDAAKAPFLRAIEKQFDGFRSCYVKVDDPVKGGTFGVDLHIGRDGGQAQVKQPRTGMKGTGFRDCVVRVFEQIEFDKPKKGPTVISYSIKYSLAK